MLHASGSVLCPRPFILYIADLDDEVQEHQLYLHCCHYDNTAAVTRLETCLDGVSHWMAANWLKVNAEKTKLLWAGSRFSAEAQLGSKGLSVKFGTETVPASDHVRVLGVTFSSDLSLERLLLVFAPRAFIGCTNYDVSDDP